MASCVPLGDSVSTELRWNIKGSGAGYYAFHNYGGYTLGQRWPDTPGTSGAVTALHGFFDTTRWKLLNFDSDHWRIVNKDTGLVLTSGLITAKGFDNKVTATVDRGPALSQRWLLVRDELPPAEAVGAFTKLSRESGVAKLEPKILDALSPHIATQVWIISEAFDGWFTLKSFIYGFLLGLDAAKNFIPAMHVSKKDAAYHWKFIQDVIGTDIALVNRTALSDNLGISGALPVISTRVDNDRNQRWKLVPQTGSSPDLLLPSGVYTISSYAPAILSDTVSRTDTIAAAIQERAKWEATALSAIIRIAEEVELKFPQLPPLPKGVDIDIASATIKAEDDTYVDEVLQITTMLVSAIYQDTLAKRDQTGATTSITAAAQNIGTVLGEFARTYPDQQKGGNVDAIPTVNISKPAPGAGTLPPAPAPAPPKPDVEDEELQSALVDMTMAM
ncbi:hypothetical protein EDC01DRAFT_784305 [Geopyxis carbonaria]|nr:hypothetical protein EDC01DRAFT_784305 [Geopyxis carbonaria]